MDTKAWVSGIVLALFVTAGSLKGAPILADVSSYLDLTVITGAAVLVMTIKRMDLRSATPAAQLPKPYMLLGLFCLLMIISLLYAPDLAGGLDKTARFLVFSVLAAVAPVFLVKMPASRRSFLLSLLVIGGATAAAGLVKWSANPTDFGGALGANHITLGRLSGMAALIGLALGAFGSTNYQRAFGLGAAAATVGALVISSARGPLLALIIALPATLFFLRSGGRFSRLKILLASAALPLATWAIIAIGWLPPVFSERLEHVLAVFSGGYSDGSVTNRLALAGRGLRAIASSPVFGLGVGGFPSVAWDLPANHYPHNIFIETAAELGLPALFILAAFILAAVVWLGGASVQVDSQEDRFITFAAGGLLVFWLINAMLSGDLNDNRLLLATIGLIFAHVQSAGLRHQHPAKNIPKGETG